MKNMEFELQVQKELEKEMEKSKLAEVLDIINSEILINEGRKKQIAEQILYYREKVLEEYRDDEDKVAEYFDHERFVKEESFKVIDRKLRELNVLKEIPYFGRVDFKDVEYEDEDVIYIGRFGVTPEENLEPVVVDWRSPVSALFYTGRLGESSYNAPMGNVPVDILKKRQFIIKKRSLLGLFDSEMDVKDEILQMVLSSNTNEKLKDIIMTIQQEQDDIIRQPKYGTVVVDGVAGSGKTTIALHRVAYLLYNFRTSLQDKVLILGPNNIFMEYISQVLPSLGEVGVNQTTFTDFALDLLDVDVIMGLKEYMEKIINADEVFIGTTLYKTSSKYIEELDKYINDLNQEYFKYKDIILEGKVAINKGEIERLFNESYKSMPLFRRNGKIKRIIFSRIKDVRDEKVREIEKEYKDAILSKTKEELELIETQLKYNRKNKIRELIKRIIEVKRNLTWLEPKGVENLYNEFNNNELLTIDDLAPMLYLKTNLEGMKYNKEVKHVVIDEAQDYSELQFKVIKELTGCSGFTIVGDRNQRILPIEGELAMTKLRTIFKETEVMDFKLNKSYRSTAEIMKYANKYLTEEKVIPLVRQGKEVDEIITNNSSQLKERLLVKIQELKDSGYLSIGIICKNLVETLRISALLKGETEFKVFQKEDMSFGEGVMLIPAYFAKGLEFDSAIIIQNEKDKVNDKLSYVMATRALHELSVIIIK
ncbi:MAG: AAA family ATPase [Clostridiaceae bacterium]|nr:AAA family ATPase [Clostridiaceae bacterium]